MPAAISVEFRTRIISAYDDGMGSVDEVAAYFGVGPASVGRWLALRRETGGLEPRPAGGNHGRQQGLSQDARQFVQETLEAVADSTLVELVQACSETFEEKVSPQAMSEVVKKLGFTRKRGPTDHERPTDPNSSSRERSSLKSRSTWILTSSCSSTRRV